MTQPRRTRPSARKPKVGDKVRVRAAGPDGPVYTVAKNQRHLPYPYYLDDGNPDNPLLAGPYAATDLKVAQDG